MLSFQLSRLRVGVCEDRNRLTKWLIASRKSSLRGQFQHRMVGTICFVCTPAGNGFTIGSRATRFTSEKYQLTPGELASTVRTRMVIFLPDDLHSSGHILSDRAEDERVVRFVCVSAASTVWLHFRRSRNREPKIHEKCVGPPPVSQQTE